MNLPEGWPTEEMAVAGWNAYHKVMNGHEPTGLDAITAAFNAMLAAAPTPPAQENENRLCPECGAECMHVSIPNSYWYKCKKCSWESSPAQEGK